MPKDIELRYQALEARLALVEGRDCDEADYLIAVFCGVMAGAVDAFFVGKPNIGENTEDSILGKEIDRLSEIAVERFADINIEKDNKTYDLIKEELLKENLSKRELNQRLKEELEKRGIPANFSRKKGYEGLKGQNSKLVYLENKYRVSYDQPTKSKIKEDISFVLSPNNHHIKSIAHWPDLLGLLVAIFDQFTGKTTFISEGKIYRVTPDQNLPILRGSTFIEKIFYGFVNWFGHLISDFCGSHSSKGRGDGIPIPFFGVFTACDFGNFSYGETDTQNGLTLSQLAVKVFENGYDARFAVTMAIPVLLQDLMIRFIWSLKARFVHKKPWAECIPSTKHKDLRMMLLVGNASLCVVDGADALIRSKGNLMEFILHMNIIAWFQLAKNSLKEICIRFDFTYADLKTQYEFLNYQMDIYIQKLKAVDYDLYNQKLQDLSYVSEYMAYNEWDVAAEALDEHVKKHRIKTIVRDKEDFANKLTSPGFKFTIGG